MWKRRSHTAQTISKSRLNQNPNSNLHLSQFSCVFSQLSCAKFLWYSHEKVFFQPHKHIDMAVAFACAWFWCVFWISSCHNHSRTRSLPYRKKTGLQTLKILSFRLWCVIILFWRKNWPKRGNQNRTCWAGFQSFQCSSSLWNVVALPKRLFFHIQLRVL